MSDILQQLAQVLEQRKQESAEKSYVASLYAKGLDTILKRLAKKRRKPSLLEKAAINSRLFTKPQTFGFTVWCCLPAKALGRMTC